MSVIEISCFNAPNSVALSGSADLLDKAIESARAEGIFAQHIRALVPRHSSFMDAIKDDYLACMSDIFKHHPDPHVPSVPVFSTCSGRIIIDEFTPVYFWNTCRNPVLFSPAISKTLSFHVATESNPVISLEISCHAVLSSSIMPHGVAETSVVCPIRRSLATNPEQRVANEQILFTETLAKITLLGYNPCDPNGIYRSSDYKPSFINHSFVSRSILPPKSHFFQAVRGGVAIDGPLLGSRSVTELTHPPPRATRY